MSQVFSSPVASYMTRSVVSVGASATLEHARELLERMRISAMPVLDAAGRAIGVVSRTDLLRVGHFEPLIEGHRSALRLPDLQVEAVMTRGIVTIDAETSVVDAARVIVDQRIHRIYVEGPSGLAGVFSTRDVMAAIVDAKLTIPIANVMTRALVCVEAGEPVRVAIERLGEAGVSGLAVLERGAPAGVFTQEDALAARMHPPDTPVEQAMGFFHLVLPASTMVHVAAARAAALRVRHILVRDDGSLGQTLRPARDTDATQELPALERLVGVVTGVDLAGAVLLA